MECCPNCRARLVPEQEECQRCGMALARLWGMLAEASQLDKAAARALMNGNLWEAQQLLVRRLHLKQNSLLQKFLVFVRTA